MIRRSHSHNLQPHLELLRTALYVTKYYSLPTKPVLQSLIIKIIEAFFARQSILTEIIETFFVQRTSITNEVIEAFFVQRAISNNGNY